MVDTPAIVHGCTSRRRMTWRVSATRGRRRAGGRGHPRVLGRRSSGPAQDELVLGEPVDGAEPEGAEPEGGAEPDGGAEPEGAEPEGGAEPDGGAEPEGG